jgi:hypothetical protein
MLVCLAEHQESILAAPAFAEQAPDSHPIAKG